MEKTGVIFWSNFISDGISKLEWRGDEFVSAVKVHLHSCPHQPKPGVEVKETLLQKWQLLMKSKKDWFKFGNRTQPQLQ